MLWHGLSGYGAGGAFIIAHKISVYSKVACSGASEVINNSHAVRLVHDEDSTFDMILYYCQSIARDGLKSKL